MNAAVIAPTNQIDQFLRISNEINLLADRDAILDRILLEARQIAQAEAGSIFLLDGDRLRFSYVHNDVLFEPGAGNAAVYSDFSVPISHASIVGHVALSGETLAIDDAYELAAGLPFAFNDSFDQATGYRTRSILTVPLKIVQGRLVGVMQVINARNAEGQPVTFSPTARNVIELFAGNAAVAIERALMTREMILRMMKMAELRDPAETGLHVQRVGAYAAEVYQQYARGKGVPTAEIKRQKDLLGLAAMLHDVGKVGIADAILKKPGRLDADEFEQMKNHTILGVQLFDNAVSELDAVCREIALRHHEKWDGSGYPGQLAASADGAVMPAVSGPGLAGKQIPLAARICAVADVYDALVSKRVYKEAQPEDQVLARLEAEAGHHFDPEVVTAFLAIHDVILAIRQKYC